MALLDLVRRLHMCPRATLFVAEHGGAYVLSTRPEDPARLPAEMALPDSTILCAWQRSPQLADVMLLFAHAAIANIEPPRMLHWVYPPGSRITVVVQAFSGIMPCVLGFRGRRGWELPEIVTEVPETHPIVVARRALLQKCGGERPGPGAWNDARGWGLPEQLTLRASPVCVAAGPLRAMVFFPTTAHTSIEDHRRAGDLALMTVEELFPSVSAGARLEDLPNPSGTAALAGESTARAGLSCEGLLPTFPAELRPGPHTSVVLYHGTTLDAAHSIAASGFREICEDRTDPDACTAAGVHHKPMLGAGAVSLARFEKAVRFAQRRAKTIGGTAAVIRCVVAPRRPMRVRKYSEVCGCGCRKPFVDHLGSWKAETDLVLVPDDSRPACNEAEWAAVPGVVIPLQVHVVTDCVVPPSRGDRRRGTATGGGAAYYTHMNRMRGRRM